MFANWVRFLINDYRHLCSACRSFCCSVFTGTVRSPERLDDRQRVIIVNFIQQFQIQAIAIYRAVFVVVTHPGAVLCVSNDEPERSDGSVADSQTLVNSDFMDQFTGGGRFRTNFVGAQLCADDLAELRELVDSLSDSGRRRDQK